MQHVNGFSLFLTKETMGNQYQFTQNGTKSLAGGGYPAVSARFDITQFIPMQHDVLLSHSQLTPTSNFSSDSTQNKEEAIKNFQQGGRVGK